MTIVFGSGDHFWNDFVGQLFPSNVSYFAFVILSFKLGVGFCNKKYGPGD